MNPICAGCRARRRRCETAQGAEQAAADVYNTVTENQGGRVAEIIALPVVEQPDANGFLPHPVGGNRAAPLVGGCFRCDHPAGINFAFGDGQVVDASEW